MRSANLILRKDSPLSQSEIGVVGDFTLLLEGKIEGDSINGTGSLAIAPSAKIVVRLTKRTADLF